MRAGFPSFQGAGIELVSLYSFKQPWIFTKLPEKTMHENYAFPGFALIMFSHYVYGVRSIFRDPLT